MSLTSWLNRWKTSGRHSDRRDASREPRRRRLGQEAHGAIESLEQRMMLAVNLSHDFNWTEQGPAPLLNTDVGNVAGAMQSLAVNPALPNLMYAAATNGGIWKTTNALDARPTWTPQTDAIPGLSLGAIAFSPLDASGATLFAGSAAFSSAARLAGQLNGLRRTTDGGAHWQLFLGAGQSGLEFQRHSLSIHNVIPTEINDAGNPAANIDEQVVLIAASQYFVLPGDTDNGGIFRSTDGGRTVTRVLEGSATDIIADAADPTHKTFYAGLRDAGPSGIGFYRSTDGGVTWEIRNRGLLGSDISTEQSKLVRIDLEASDATGHPIYAAIIREFKEGTKTKNRVGAIVRFDRATDGWTKIGNIPAVNPGGQAERHFAMLPDPTDPNIIYIGGDRSDTGPEANIYRIDTSTTANSGRVKIVGGNAHDTTPHVDTRDFAFLVDNSGNQYLFAGDDGGVYRMNSPSSAADRQWVGLNYGLGTAESYSVAWNSITNTIMSGNQDNGSTAQPAPLNGVDDDNDGPIDEEDERLAWREVYGGDGFAQGFGAVPAGGKWYAIQNNFANAKRATFNSSGAIVSTDPIGFAKPGSNPVLNARSGLTADDSREVTTGGAFYIPLAVNDVSLNRIVVGYHGLYESTDGGDHITVVDKGRKEKDLPVISAVAYGHPGNVDIIYAARGNRLIVSDAAAKPGSKRTTSEGPVEGPDRSGTDIEASDIVDIAIDPADWRTVYVIDALHVFKSTDAGDNWRVLDDPDIVGSLTSIVVFQPGTPTGDTRTLVVGSDSGVFYAGEANGNVFRDWLRLNGNMPRALVRDLVFNEADNVLIAGTMGRGSWKLENAKAALDVNPFTEPILTVTATNGNDEIVISRTNDNPTLIHVIVNGALEGSYDRRMLDSIAIQTLGGSDTVRLVADDGGTDLTNGGGSYLPSINSLIGVNGGHVAGETNTLVIEGPATLRNSTPGTPTQASFVIADTSVLKISYGDDVTLVNNVQPLQAKQNWIRTGLQRLSEWSQDIKSAVHGKIAGFESSVDELFNGVNRNQFFPTSDPEKKGNIKGFFQDAGSEFLGRVFEEGTGGFSLTDIGTPGGINSLEDLRTRLLALDADPSTTVTLSNDTAGNPVLDFQVVKTINGSADFDVDLADSLISLGGVATLTADVRMHLRFGVDNTGFYIAAEQNTDPEIIVSNIRGTIAGNGRIGFIGVLLPNGQFAMDPGVKLNINLHDPGTDMEDGLIRIDELSGQSNDLITVTLQDDAADGLNDDITFTGNFQVDVLGFQLPELTLGLKWPSASDPSNVQIDAGATFRQLLNIDANQVIDTILGAAEQMRQATGVDIFAQKIPLLEKSVNDLLGGAVDEKFADADINDITTVFQADGFNKFQVLLNDVDAASRGIKVEDAVRFKGTDNADHTGVVDSVDSAGFVVRFELSQSVTPLEGAAESVVVARRASLRDQIDAALRQLTNPVGLTARTPTIQDLGDELGIDLTEIKLSAAGDAIEIPFSFALDPIHFSRKLDLGGSIAGLNLSAGGDIDVAITPSFAFTVGARFTSGVPLADRIYLKDNADPEVTLSLQVKLDNPTASGSIGFLDVALSEDGSNDGISFTGQLQMNLTDPGTGAGADGRILLSELTPANLLSSFDASVAADFVINPLKIVASVGDSTELGKITIRLDAADGHVTSLADLTDLPSKIQIAGASNFANFQNITPQMIVDALQALIEKLRSIGGGGVLDAKLPVIDKSLSEIVDLGEEFATRLGLLGPDGVSTAQKLQDFLQAKLGNAVAVTVKSDSIQFSLNFTQDLAESIPVSLNLGDQFGLLMVEGGGTVNFTGAATANATFGLLTGANIPLARRLYLDTDGADASSISITGNANIGFSGSGPGFNATVKLGFLDFGITNARAMVELTQLLGQVKDPGNSGGEGAGRLTFQEIVDNVAAGHYTAILDGNYTGRVQAVIPLDGPDAGTDVDLPPGSSSTDALIEVAGKLENLTNGFEFTDPGLHTDTAVPLTLAELDQGVFAGKTKVLVYAHNLDNLIANAIINFDNLLAGLEKLIEWGDKLLGTGVLDFELPFTGAKIRDALNFLKDPSGPLQTIIAAINGSGALGDQPSDAAAELAAQQIKGVLAGIPGLTPTVAGGQILEIQHDSANHVTGATFKFKLSVPFNLPLANPQFDLGLDFFNLKSDLNLGVSGSVDLLIGLGVDKSNNGFYLITDFPEVGPNVPELAVRNLRLSVNGNTSLDVGFLELAAAFDPLKNFLQANFSVNLNGLGDNRLTLSELADFARLPAVIDGNPGTPELDGLQFTVEAKMDVPLSVEADPDFPSVSTNFVLQWGPFNLNDVRDRTTAFTSPLVELKDLRLNPGEFITHYALPFFSQINKYNVVAPLVDKLDAPVPIIGGTLFDLLVTNNPLLSQRERDIATFLFNVSRTIDDFSDQAASASTLQLHFGDVKVRPDRSLDTTNASESGQADNPTPLPTQFPGDHLPFIGGLIHDIGDIGITFPMLSLSNLMQLFMGKNVDLIFAELPQLHVGKSFGFEIPIYSIGIPYIAGVTVNALFGGSIDLYVNVSAGLDSSGISHGLSHVLDGLYIGDYAPGDDHQIGAGDKDRPELLLEASVTAGIDAKAELLGFDLLSVTGTATIGGGIGLDLNDDNDNIQPPDDPRDQAQRTDGKFYISEIEQVIDSAGGNPFCMFDLVGELFAKLAFEIHIPLLPNPDWSHRWTLAKFEIECKPVPITPDFADIVGTTLLLTSNSGSDHTTYHSYSATNHPDGDPLDIFLIDKNGDASDGSETLRISKLGYSEDFGPGETGNNHIDDVRTLTLISDQGTGSGKFQLTNFGRGPDSITVDPQIRIPVRLSGGSENDTLIAGDGGGTLRGGDGDDYLALAAAPAGLSAADRLLRNAFFDGGVGSDQIFGGVGNDTALGGEGNDTVDGGGGDADSGNDILVGGGGDDVLDGRGGADRVIGDYDQSRYPRPASGAEEGADFIVGGADGDILWGDNRGLSDSADGPAPDPARATSDFIFGGDDSDLIFGGGGNDQIDAGAAGPLALPNRVFGGVGNDTITGGDGRDSLVGQAGNDLIDGGGDDDVLYAGDDTFGPNASQLGFDVMTGGEGNDLLDGSDADAVTAAGGSGSDSIVGSRGADDLAGDTDRDFILAGPNNDVVSGGEGDDDVLGGDGSVAGFTVNFAEDDGADSIVGEGGNDVLLGDNGTIDAGTRSAFCTETGGFGIDAVGGNAGNDTILGGGAGDRLDGGDDADIIIGDLGSVSTSVVTVTPSTTGGPDTATGGDGDDILVGGDAGDELAGDAGADLAFGDFGTIDRSVPANVSFTSTFTQVGAGGADIVRGGAGNDTAIGGQGADQISGDDGDDDLIGGHNVSAGADAGDAIDGGGGADAIAGDNASIVRRGDALSPLVRVLVGTTLYNAAGAPAVTATPQLNPAGLPGRDVTLFDHSTTTAANRFGSDMIAGGPGDDSLWGQRGDDVMQGDGSVALIVSATMPSMEATTDGDDYMEGGGGSDLMFGNLGQDDLLGGSSNLFGLISPDQRPDGSDTLFGGAGTRTTRNDAGDTAATGHARDADVLLGDNGTVYRVVGTNGASTGAFLTFNYDNYTPALRIIPRTIGLLDYTPGTGSAGDRGAADFLHGEAGDDALYAAAGNDVLFGDGQDDDMFGGAGSDWMSGGSGHDGMLGDDGRIFTSRNGSTEPLNNLTTPNVQTTITIPHTKVGAVVSITGRLTKEVDLTPFDSGSSDIMYGGLGDDFMHGGGGDDAMSGAEALANFYNSPQPNPNPLGYNPATRKLAAYDANNPRTKINGFLLNFEAYTDPSNQIGTKVNDGKDRLFGDGGNDWLVGGTMNDRMFGGMGDDLLNADDNHDNGTTPGLNNRPDVSQFADADFAFGGGGLDVLIANTGADRLFDWNGEFNSYFVPFSLFAAPTVNRTPGTGPATFDFLLMLGDRGGADPTVSEPYGELGLVTPADPQWSDQSGPPRDPQPGSISGVQRDTEGSPENDTGNSNTYTLKARRSASRSQQSIPQLTSEALAPIAAEAIRRWSATTPSSAVKLNDVTFQIADLSRSVIEVKL